VSSPVTEIPNVSQGEIQLVQVGKPSTKSNRMEDTNLLNSFLTATNLNDASQRFNMKSSVL